QSSTGGGGAFDVDNRSDWIYRIPFFDFGAAIDPPSEDVTAHAVEALAPHRAYAETTKRGLDYLLREQQEDGSWWGRWGVNHVYGTGAALPALQAAGEDMGAAPARRAVAWLERHQNPDGGWGEDILSYRDPAWVGRGHSTASQT